MVRRILLEGPLHDFQCLFESFDSVFAEFLRCDSSEVFVSSWGQELLEFDLEGVMFDAFLFVAHRPMFLAVYYGFEFFQGSRNWFQREQVHCFSLCPFFCVCL